MRECISVHLYRVWRISKELSESCTTRNRLYINPTNQLT